ncbi:MAG: hypothetical protein ABDH31_00280 [Chlorobiota bacterium]
MSSEALTGVVWGVGLCSANFLLSYLTARWAFRKSLQLFLRWVLGGMVVRLLATSAAAGYLLAVEKVHPLGFALSFSVGVAVLLTAEIVDFHRRYETFRLRPLTTP